MWNKLGERGRLGWRGALIAALLLGWWNAAQHAPKPELRMHLEVALLLGGKGIAVALIR